MPSVTPNKTALAAQVPANRAAVLTRGSCTAQGVQVNAPPEFRLWVLDEGTQSIYIRTMRSPPAELAENSGSSANTARTMALSKPTTSIVRQAASWAYGP